MASAAQNSALTARIQHLRHMIDGGSLDAKDVNEALDAIIAGRFEHALISWQPPVWWRTAELQMARAREIWGDIELPDPPAAFVPQSPGEVLLLHVPAPLDDLWDSLSPHDGYATRRRKGLSSHRLRLSPNLREYPRPVWLAFNAAYGSGESPGSLWGQPDLAGIEVLSALLQFPDWPLSWEADAYAPYLAGYHYQQDGYWSHVLCLMMRRSRGKPEIKLTAINATHARQGWSSPTVQECAD